MGLATWSCCWDRKTSRSQTSRSIDGSLAAATASGSATSYRTIPTCFASTSSNSSWRLGRALSGSGSRRCSCRCTWLPGDTWKPGGLREPLSVAHGIFAESHYSANSFRDNMRRLVDIFEMQPDQLTIYLRQDRDAGGDGVA